MKIMAIAGILILAISGCVSDSPSVGNEDSGSDGSPVETIAPSPVDKRDYAALWMNLTGRLTEPRAEHQPHFSQRELESLECPQVQNENLADAPSRIHIATPTPPWPQGQWRCLTVFFQNSGEEPFRADVQPGECLGIVLEVQDPERGPMPPLRLKTARGTDYCVQDSTAGIEPDTEIRANFYWQTGIEWALPGPYVDPDRYRLDAYFTGTNHTWDASADASVIIDSGPVVQTVDCSENPSPMFTPMEEPRIELLTPGTWPQDHWVCLEAWFNNTSPNGYVVEVNEYVKEMKVHAFDGTGDSIPMARPTMPETVQPAIRSIHFDPGDVFVDVLWWPPGLGAPGSYLLVAKFPAVAESWPTEDMQVISVAES